MSAGAALNETPADLKFRLLMHNFRNYLKGAIAMFVPIILQSVMIPPGSTYWPVISVPQEREITRRILCILFLSQQPPVGQGLLIHEASRSHTTTHHSRQGFSGRVISSSQIPLTDNTQHSQQTSISPAEYEPTISEGERPQNYALDRTATGTVGFYVLFFNVGYQ
jgi:hypothetical protein